MVPPADRHARLLCLIMGIGIGVLVAIVLLTLAPPCSVAPFTP